MLPKTEPPQRPPALLRRDPGRPLIPQSPIVPSIPADALTEFGPSSGSSWWTPQNPSGSSKSSLPSAIPHSGGNAITIPNGLNSEQLLGNGRLDFRQLLSDRWFTGM